ncbi:tRNA (guanosine(37)-N1)-methyltransferase TrmD [Vulgatibacter incomptus]
MIEGPASESILGKAAQRGLVEVRVRDIRDHAHDKHHVTDDVPYGGGAGMVMKPEPLVEAIEAAKAAMDGPCRVVLLDPGGRTFTQAVAREYRDVGRLILVCGRYEGFDERIRSFADEELSVGDFVLTGGELAALCVVDACSRLVPGVLGNVESAGIESFEEGLLEYPQYTRPPDFRGMKVPEVLLSGDHAKIARWRRKHALLRTKEKRPDLFSRLELGKADRALLDEA